jgi:hypothetical protein
MRCEVSARIDNRIQEILLQNDGNGHWSLSNKPAPEFDNCVDVDIPLTPLTNSLPVNRLKLKQSEEREISVIYIDLLEDEISVKNQKYRRLSKEVYKYENIPNDFEAEIVVDDEGVVVDYPQLFVRSMKLSGNK